MRVKQFRSGFGLGESTVPGCLYPREVIHSLLGVNPQSIITPSTSCIAERLPHAPPDYETEPPTPTQENVYDPFILQPDNQGEGVHLTEISSLEEDQLRLGTDRKRARFFEEEFRRMINLLEQLAKRKNKLAAGEEAHRDRNALEDAQVLLKARERN